MTTGFQLASRFDSTTQSVMAAGVSVAVFVALGRLVVHYFNKPQQQA
jgi:hypothetical protein